MGTLPLRWFPRSWARAAGWISLGSLLLLACRDQTPKHSPLFRQLFRYDSAAFRGVDPGDPIDLPLRQEDRSHLLHQDDLGLSYRLSLGQDRELLIDYHSDKLRTEQSSNEVASIVANLRLGDEVETARLYSEVLAYFNQQYGVASGVYGDYVWEGLTRDLTRMEAHLRMSDNKKGLTINFVDTEPEPEPSRHSSIELDSLGRLLPSRPVPREAADSMPQP